MVKRQWSHEALQWACGLTTTALNALIGKCMMDQHKSYVSTYYHSLYIYIVCKWTYNYCMWLNLLYVTELKGHLKVKWMQTYAAIYCIL